MKRLFISLAVAMVLVAVMVTPAMAANTDDTVITGTVSGVIDVTAPDDFAISPMTLGGTATGNGSGTVIANAAWTMTAKDTKGTDTGYMTTLGGDVLAYEMEISDDNTTWYPASGVGGNGTLTYSGSATGASGTSFTLYASQVLDTYEEAGDYSITITFTGSIP